ncbi:UDP-2,4-diacetamido-2,4,6-trideoxy-beta-L-altropyranose hydrolase [Desulforamulus aquiferis]|uniref:UDP-2,4-diacetamido-2,4, 6-trideoxy-beta-L-altropyranose hydrolase n=1 Tax=Desulforamulus aquiferis TaxID=1397668 RepID=A0AAW7ZFX3_9FIRM|nr:UDP-2,4-diacetamido-2,4,6-trideoxy-beta-L-altropyranose hydrolase [Desulforamulus aquiferis]MDO7788277.1 UDP-2,4-diacetamido-2,4,6-trideoxy-beta-L-altropyranose hydrolase [Desulforamulus aquiferis]RYD03465.1 hypothetical protein N752_20000 [Desulforamulus aquiferis]
MLIAKGKKLLLRADASGQIGIGHVMRSLALAQAWQDMGGEAAFLCLALPSKLKGLLNEEKIKTTIKDNILIGSVDDARLTAELARELGITWVIADGYDYNSHYQGLIKEWGLKLLIVDDFGHANYYPADIILNPGLDTNKGLYSNRETYTRLLLGPKYITLRREFIKLQRTQQEIAQEAKKILVTMGGADPGQVTLKAVEGLIDLGMDLQIKVVIGPAYTSTDKLMALAANGNVLILQDVKYMSSLFQWADLGLTAGGCTVAEMAYMGLPSIIIQTAENQYASQLYENKYGAAIFAGDAQTITKDHICCCVKTLCNDYPRRLEMSNNACKLVDGKGSYRIFEYIV